MKETITMPIQEAVAFMLSVNYSHDVSVEGTLKRFYSVIPSRDHEHHTESRINDGKWTVMREQYVARPYYEQRKAIMKLIDTIPNFSEYLYQTLSDEIEKAAAKVGPDGKLGQDRQVQVELLREMLKHSSSFTYPSNDITLEVDNARIGNKQAYTVIQNAVRQTASRLSGTFGGNIILDLTKLPDIKEEIELARELVAPVQTPQSTVEASGTEVGPAGDTKHQRQ